MFQFVAVKLKKKKKNLGQEIQLGLEHEYESILLVLLSYSSSAHNCTALQQSWWHSDLSWDNEGYKYAQNFEKNRCALDLHLES